MDVLQTMEGTKLNNWTKNNPCLSADLFGDWREEIVVRDSENSELRVYMTDFETNYMIYSLMHDPTYRNAVANQNTAYNQPPHVGFYLGEDNADQVLAKQLPVANIRYTTEGQEGGENTMLADKTALQAAIASAEALNQADYTAETWANMQAGSGSSKGSIGR